MGGGQSSSKGTNRLSDSLCASQSGECQRRQKQVPRSFQCIQGMQKARERTTA